MFAVVPGLILAPIGCRSAARNVPAVRSEPKPNKHQECQLAIKHYETQDLADDEILKLFEQAAEHGDVCATMWIARLHYLGRCSLPARRDIGENMAKEVFGEVKQLAEDGDTEAQFLLGFSYQMGLAAPQDLTNAVMWYGKAVEGGHLTAMNNLGVMLARGHGTEPDIHQARLLFARATGLGSRGAEANLSAYGESERRDAEQLRALRSLNLVQALGIQKEAGIAFLASKGLISDPKQFSERVYNERKQYHFKADGIVMDIDPNGRIMSVEGHRKGSRDSDQYRGEIPLGATWNTTLAAALEKLGPPDDRGYLKNDEAYGLVYELGNLRAVLMFSYDPGAPLKLCRVYERWATKPAE